MRMGDEPWTFRSVGADQCAYNAYSQFVQVVGVDFFKSQRRDYLVSNFRDAPVKISYKINVCPTPGTSFSYQCHCSDQISRGSFDLHYVSGEVILPANVSHMPLITIQHKTKKHILRKRQPAPSYHFLWAFEDCVRSSLLSETTNEGTKALSLMGNALSAVRTINFWRNIASTKVGRIGRIGRQNQYNGKTGTLVSTHATSETGNNGHNRVSRCNCIENDRNTDLVDRSPNCDGDEGAHFAERHPNIKRKSALAHSRKNPALLYQYRRHKEHTVSMITAVPA